MKTSQPTRVSNALTILSDDRIAVREGASTHIVCPRDIVSVHANRNQTRIATRNGAIRVHRPFGAVLEALHRFGVVQIHRGSAVNLSKIHRLVGGGRHRLVVVLDCGAEHSVGRGFQPAVRACVSGALANPE